MTVLKTIALLSLSLSLSSCQTLWKKAPHDTTQQLRKNGTYTNIVNSEAKRIQATYGQEHSLTGNTIARYPLFEVHLVSTTIKGNDTISLFEVVSRNGLERDQLTCSSINPEKQHLYIEDSHFFYHSNQPGMINIYFPPILMVDTPTDKLTTPSL